MTDLSSTWSPRPATAPPPPWLGPPAALRGRQPAAPLFDLPPLAPRGRVERAEPTTALRSVPRVARPELRPLAREPEPPPARRAPEPVLGDYDVDSLENRRERWIKIIVNHFTPWLRRYFRAEVRGLERIPAGAGIYVANHNGGAFTPDTYLLGTALYEHGGLDGLPFGMAHDLVVRWPLLKHFFVPLGAVRACPENARRICRAGKKLLIYPGGDAEAMRPFRDRNRIMFGRRRGYLRLALREGVPIIPAVTHGAHSTAIILDDGKWFVRALGLDRTIRLKAWPTTLSIPWGITFGPPPPYVPFPTRITIEVLDPIRFDRSGEEAAADAAYVEACHRRVVDAMQAALDRLARLARR